MKIRDFITKGPLAVTLLVGLTLLLLFVVATAVQAQARTNQSPVAVAAPLMFIENVGQFDDTDSNRATAFSKRKAILGDCPSSISFGDIVECSIDVAGELDVFTFSGVAGDQVRVRVIETSGDLSPGQELLRPDGTTLCNPTPSDEQTCLLDSNGTHTILIKDWSGTNSGNYNLVLRRLNNPVGCTSLSFGSGPVSDSIEVAAETDCYTFAGAVDDQVRVRVIETSGDLSPGQELLRPDGTTLCNPTPSDEQTCLLDSNGTHTILIKDWSGTNSGNYNLVLRRLNNPVGCTSLSFGSGPVSDSIEVAAETDCYTFAGAVDDQVRVRVIETSGDLSPGQELLRPDGTTLCNPTPSDEQTCLLESNGTHTILIKDWSGTNSGNYNLMLMRLNNPVGCTSLSFGSGPVSDSIEVAAETDCYTFAGAVDDQVRVRVIETSGNLSPGQELLRPDGTTLCNPTPSDERTCQLDSNGTHTILIKDWSGTNTGDYQLTTTCLTPPCGDGEPTVTPTETSPPITPTSTPTNTPPASATSPTNTPIFTPTNTPTPTPVPPDPYEPNDSCEQATEIATDGTIQVHTFHEQADEDWVTFEAIKGVEYIIEGRVPPDSPANLILEAYEDCESVPDGQDPPFSVDIRYRFVSPVDGNLVLHLLNQDPTTYGVNVEYHLSVRALDGSAEHGALILVAGKYTEGDELQSNIHNVTNRVYQLFRSKGHPAEQIKYLATENQDADNDGQNDVDNLPSTSILQATITQWAADYVGPNRALTLYLMDHGAYDKLYLDGPRNQILRPSDLDGWLTELEDATGVKVNVIIEACNSGSFINATESLSKEGRVIVTATDAFAPSYASEEGAVFSDALLSALAQGMTVKAAFDEAVWAVSERSGIIAQVPWLDSDGNAIPNQASDDPEAERRGFAISGSFPIDQWIPHIEQASIRDFSGTQGQIWAKVLDDDQVERVWAVIYPPSYSPPDSSEEIVPEPPRLPLLTLQDVPYGKEVGVNWLFEEKGEYRIVIYAEDNERLTSRPKEIILYTGSELFLPIVRR